MTTPANDYIVVTLYDINNDIAAYTAGKAAELENFQTTGWSVVPGGPIDSPVTVLRRAIKSGTRADRRFAELGGVLVDGKIFMTNSRSITFLTLAASTTTTTALVECLESENNIYFEASYVELDSAGISDVLSAINDHFQACYSWHKSICDLADAAETIEDLQAIDLATGLPARVSELVPDE